jgi:acylphosphatase
VRHYFVNGRVQGVGFRWFVRRAADELGVTGWVRNVPDGRVEAEAAGTEEQLAAFEERLSQGPPGARVTELKSTPLGAASPHERFDIVR